jgi:signal transduction histidine kinase
VHVRSEVADLVPARLRGDDTALERALWNLLDNALRFTDRGEVLLEFTGETNASGFMLKCVVRDTGRGIPAGVRERLFDSFAQADNSLARNHEGLGLGLATAKRLVERMRGMITVESTPGQGSEFSVLVPLEIVTPAPAPLVQA